MYEKYIDRNIITYFVATTVLCVMSVKKSHHSINAIKEHEFKPKVSVPHSLI